MNKFYASISALAILLLLIWVLTFSSMLAEAKEPWVPVSPAPREEVYEPQSVIMTAIALQTNAPPNLSATPAPTATPALPFPTPVPTSVPSILAPTPTWVRCGVR